jgi:hypothetical protein
MLSPGYPPFRRQRAERVRSRSRAGATERNSREETFEGKAFEDQRLEDETFDVDLQGRSVAHLVLAPGRLYRRFFARHFLWRRAYALGFLVGPRLERRLPESLLDVVARIEPCAGVGPLRSCGRFFVLDVEKRPLRGAALVRN